MNIKIHWVWDETKRIKFLTSNPSVFDYMDISGNHFLDIIKSPCPQATDPQSVGLTQQHQRHVGNSCENYKFLNHSAITYSETPGVGLRMSTNKLLR